MSTSRRTTSRSGAAGRRQQNVTFEVVQKNRDGGEPHYFLYLCEQDPVWVDLKLDVARISGKTPLLVKRASNASIWLMPVRHRGTMRFMASARCRCCDYTVSNW
ncbi:hypothetical protein [Aeromonas salmonicida]|uniref:hypothetical protein n=1 Tax=Aeromonas salmonicida TaxID=645 RepID=UPI0035A2E973